MAREYHQIVASAEEGLLACAKHSFEPHSRLFVDGQEVFKHFADAWQHGDKQLLKQRTPIQIQRDRILYSHGMRKQTEKYHVLYNGQHRIVRSYATHAMKMAQVTRAICRGLNLNEDFGEAIALGAKVGAVPFIHAAKDEAGAWASEKVITLDQQWAKERPLEVNDQQQLDMDFQNKPLPKFVAGLQSDKAFRLIQQYMPWAAGQRTASLYGSGSESYWLLCMNPFTAEIKQNQYFPETMYGIWRHTRGVWPSQDSFHHRFRLQGSSRCNEIKDAHATFEAVVVQYADDITWAIENLNDANDVALLNDQSQIYAAVCAELGGPLPQRLQAALAENDAGGIYSYFISDFIQNSSALFEAHQGTAELREELASGRVRIGLSPEADTYLDKMIEFLKDQVFIETRTRNRMEMLRSVTNACLNLIFNDEEVLPRVVAEQARLGRWKQSAKTKALRLLSDPIHRVQLSMDVLASWGDHEIYDFVGIQSL
jgi:dGTP triphosphohydrolase